jgi:predicted house-cleaning noncanonical NTP pyrophosphatase (MazG superfamily)
MEGEKNIRDMLLEITGVDIQEAMDSAFKEVLYEKIGKEIDKFLADNIERILKDTYLEMSNDFDELQDLVDKAMLSNCRPDITVTVEDRSLDTGTEDL